MASTAATASGANLVSLFYEPPRARTSIQTSGWTYCARGDCVPIRYASLLRIGYNSGLLTGKFLVSLIIYVMCAGEFFLRFFWDKPIRETLKEKSGDLVNTRMKIMIGALIFSTTCLFIRYINRTRKLFPRLTFQLRPVPYTVRSSWPTGGMEGSFRPKFISVRYANLPFDVILFTFFNRRSRRRHGYISLLYAQPCSPRCPSARHL
jgi:hypothetical protein